MAGKDGQVRRVSSETWTEVESVRANLCLHADLNSRTSVLNISTLARYTQ